MTTDETEIACRSSERLLNRAINLERGLVPTDALIDARLSFEQFCNAAVAKLLFTSRPRIIRQREHAKSCRVQSSQRAVNFSVGRHRRDSLFDHLIVAFGNLDPASRSDHTQYDPAQFNERRVIPRQRDRLRIQDQLREPFAKNRRVANIRAN
jgi:hypothetical protein